MSDDGNTVEPTVPAAPAVKPDPPAEPAERVPRKRPALQPLVEAPSEKRDEGRRIQD